MGPEDNVGPAEDRTNQPTGLITEDPTMNDTNTFSGHSDHRVPIPKLCENNYHIWKQRMEMILVREDLWDITQEAPPVNPDARWLRRDRLAKATLGLAIVDKLLVEIKHEKTAKDTWDRLERVLQHDSLGARLCLYRKLFSSRYVMGTNMSDHLSGIQEAASNLEDRGHPVDDEQICAALLGSLPRQYDTLVTAIEARSNKDITVNYIKEKIMEESQKFNTDRNQLTHVKAMHMGSQKTNTNTRGPTCFYCHKVGHIRRDCHLLKHHGSHKGFIKNKNNHATTEKETTPNHGKLTAVDHEETPDEYYSWPHWQESNRSPKAMTAKTQPCNYPDNPRQWIVDSGASHHMIKDATRLINQHTCKSDKTITTASGEQHHITVVGDYILQLKDNLNRDVNIKLENVLHTPLLTDNLLSTFKLTNLGYSVSFKGETCNLEQDKVKIKLATLNQNLYLCQEQTPTQQITDQPRGYICQHIMHERLGHRQMKDIPKNCNDQTPHTICNQEGLCESCSITKLTNKPFYPSTRQRANIPFETIHLDLCGPISPQTLGNNHYSLNIIDDHSKYCSVYLLKHKYEAAEKITEYIEQGNNFFKRRPTTLRSDGGGEFASEEFNRYLKSRGIKHHVSLPYTPQNNGTIERLNRTLTETTRALLHQSGLPRNMWGELMCTAAYLNNRTHHHGLDKTPYELWHDRQLNLDHIKTIGSRCYYLNTSPARKKKLDDRGIPGILIGYGDSAKVYRIWNPKEGKVYLSHCVLFEKEQCPLKKRHIDINYTPTEDATSQMLQTEETPNPTSDKIQLRHSERTTRGKPPNTLSHDGHKYINTQKDYYKRTTQNEEDSDDNNPYEH